MNEIMKLYVSYCLPNIVTMINDFQMGRTPEKSNIYVILDWKSH